MKFRTLCGLLCALAIGTRVPPARAQHPANPDAAALYTVTHIDFMPDRTSSEAALRVYLAEAAHDPNVVHIELLQQISAPNHFTLLETLRNQAAYNAHAEAAYTRRFRAAIQDALGSPYDERLFHAYMAR